MSAATYELLKASAGTGKTYQLVEAYASHIETGKQRGGYRPRDVVAITFTRKAAAELRQRVRARLLTAGADRGLLTELNSAPIANFHVLALQLLRSFGHEAAMPPGAQLLGEPGQDLELFLSACADAWFAKDSSVNASVRAAAPYFDLEDGLPTALWRGLSQCRENDVPLDDACFAQYDPAALQQRLHTQLLGLRDTIRDGLHELSAGAQSKAKAFLAWPISEPSADFAGWAAAWTASASCISRRGKMGALYSVEDKELITEGVAQVAGNALAQELRPHVFALTRAAWKRYQAVKEQQYQLDFGDVVERVVSVLESNVALHRVVRSRFKVVLVDEAQDTNRLQRRFVHLLAGLCGPAAGESDAASMVVVGDRKQAIYTFRGADPGAFDAFTQDIAAQGGAQRELSVSRRSCPELVGAINRLGESLFGDQYDALRPLVGDDGTALNPLGRAALTSVQLPNEGTSTHSYYNESASAVAGWVHRYVASGNSAGEVAILLRGMTRASTYLSALADAGIPAVVFGGGGFYARSEVRDVIAMLKWLTDPGDRLSAAITLRSPLVGLSDGALFNLLGPDAQRSGALEKLLRGEVADDAQTSATEARALKRIGSILPRLVRAARHLDGAATLRLADSLLDMRATYLALDDGEQRVANLDHLSNLAMRFTAARLGDATQFARVQQERANSGFAEPMVAVPAGGSRAVTISTIHQAKGLQWPVVLLPELCAAARGDSDCVAFDANVGLVFRPAGGEGAAPKSEPWERVATSKKGASQQELARLLYVAVTRAEREVVVFGATNAKGRCTPRSFGELMAPFLDADRTAKVPTVHHEVACEVAPRPDESADPVLPSTQEKSAAAWRTMGRKGIVLRGGVELPVTTLETYTTCMRRGFLKHELGLAEARTAPSGSRLGVAEAVLKTPGLDPLQRGELAHEILGSMDRFGAYDGVEAFVVGELKASGHDPEEPHLRAIADDLCRFLDSAFGSELLVLPADARHHEFPFQLHLSSADAPAVDESSPQPVTIRGQIDLLYWDDRGPVVVDFKHADGDGIDSSGGTPYSAQLEAYACAVASLCELDADHTVRTRLVYLKGAGRVLDLPVTPDMRRQWRERATGVASRLLKFAIGNDTWPGLEAQKCADIGCGHMERCHGGGVP